MAGLQGPDELVRLVRHAGPLSINGRRVQNLPALWDRITAEVDRLAENVQGSIVHGDLCLSNILYDLRSRVCKLLDPRGSFGVAGIHGDPRYDVAKLYHSVYGLYDFLTNDLFHVSVAGDEIRLDIRARPYHRQIRERFEKVFFPRVRPARDSADDRAVVRQHAGVALRCAGSAIGDVRPGAGVVRRIVLHHRVKLQQGAMRICIDLDGVVCRLREPDQTYADLQPVPGAVEKLRALRAAGHYLILYTARHMKTCGGNVGQVVARQGATTLDWLKRHGIEFDEFHFGKPHADVYIDDNAVRFEGWDQIAADGSSLPMSNERRLAGRTQGESQP